MSALSVSRILARFEQASESPMSGRVVPEYKDPALRELFWKNYRLVYSIEEDRILIVAIVHGS